MTTIIDSNVDRPILVVEDSQHTASLICTYLKAEGYETLIAHDGESALQKAHSANPWLVILDVVLPDLDGMEVCSELRNDSNIPIIMLTARQREADKIKGLNLGADDYIVKPFSPQELIARIKAVSRRAYPPSTALLTKPLFQDDELVVDENNRQVILHNKTIALTPTEFTLLVTLIKSPGRVFSRETLLDHLYPQAKSDYVIDRVIDVHVSNLRRKLGNNEKDGDYIATVWGIGYRFCNSKHLIPVT